MIGINVLWRWYMDSRMVLVWRGWNYSSRRANGIEFMTSNWFILPYNTRENGTTRSQY